MMAAALWIFSFPSNIFLTSVFALSVYAGNHAHCIFVFKNQPSGTASKLQQREDQVFLEPSSIIASSQTVFPMWCYTGLRLRALVINFCDQIVGTTPILNYHLSSPDPLGIL